MREDCKCRAECLFQVQQRGTYMSSIVSECDIVSAAMMQIKNLAECAINAFSTQMKSQAQPSTSPESAVFSCNAIACAIEEEMKWISYKRPERSTSGLERGLYERPPITPRKRNRNQSAHCLVAIVSCIILAPSLRPKSVGSPTREIYTGYENASTTIPEHFLPLYH